MAVNLNMQIRTPILIVFVLVLAVSAYLGYLNYAEKHKFQDQSFYCEGMPIPKGLKPEDAAAYCSCNSVMQSASLQSSSLCRELREAGSR
ncbi:hypothetical protein BEN74_03175 [Acinetobacter sp. WCHAc010034]|uniref:hypothetical protein n=1 Tax=Acinetobacter sp. WCHAc010034 TaxID=1879049 RepID=UPI00083B0E48|nr:hypothetical protein [Acinetobacter sp. WCHAc010034]AYA01958.1 hypothetical protein BEN74_03175 [Acinetobacter sp. WCHAc010034]